MTAVPNKASVVVAGSNVQLTQVSAPCSVSKKATSTDGRFEETDLAAVCPILGRRTSVHVLPFASGNWRLLECSETGFVFLDQPPAYEQLQVELAWEHTSQVERERRQEAEPVRFRISEMLKSLKRRLNPKRNKIVSMSRRLLSRSNGSSQPCVLDLGCGNGHNLMLLASQLASRNCQPRLVGIEISQGLAAATASRLSVYPGATVLCDSAIGGAQKLPPQSVDLVMMSSFLEHEAQPLSLLKELSRILTADGSIILKVPNFACWNRHIRGTNWSGFRFPDHVNYFTPATLGRLAREAGYSCHQRFNDCLPLSDNMYAVLTKDSVISV